jgi:hypothetical protein
VTPIGPNSCAGITAAGLVAGVGLAFGSTPLLASLLYGITPLDPRRGRRLPAGPPRDANQRGHGAARRGVGEGYYWLIVPLGAIVNAKPGSSPLPGVVAFWTSGTSFTETFLVTAPVGFSSHAFWSFIRNDTRMLIGTSVNVISYRSGGMGCSGMAEKLRQLGWM